MPAVIDPSIANTLAPTGALRASINLGNPILADRDATTGQPVGVSIDLANALGQRLGVSVELLTFDKAVRSVEAVRSEHADIGFFAIDPARGEGLRFTAPYLLIEGSYLVEARSVLQTNADVDGAGTRVGVGVGSAYDLFLTRELKAATVVHSNGANAVRAALMSGQIDVAAGIRQLLEGWACEDATLRMLPGRFMVIQQAMGVPANRGEAAAAFVAAFVEEMKTTGFVAEALARHRMEGASVAPTADAAYLPY